MPDSEERPTATPEQHNERAAPRSPAGRLAGTLGQSPIAGLAARAGSATRQLTGAKDAIGRLTQPARPGGQTGLPGMLERTMGDWAATPERRAAAALGGVSLALGGAELLAPRAVAAVAGLRRGPVRRALLRAMGLREITAGLGVFATTDPTPLIWARVGGDALDLVLLARALRSPRNGRVRVALCFGLVSAITAADVATAVRLARATAASGEGLEGRAAVTVDRPVDEVFEAWRHVERFPSFMAHLESVQVTGPGRSHWRAKAPAGRGVEWDAEITEERPCELLAWRSLPGSAISTEGEVRFAAAPGDRGTEVVARVRYHVPGGRYGVAAARLFGESPPHQVRDDLRRFKQVLETGGVVVSEGAPSSTSLPAQLRQQPGQPGGRPGDGLHGSGVSMPDAATAGRGPGPDGGGGGDHGPSDGESERRAS
jgi:uncharacterized membrane protein